MISRSTYRAAIAVASTVENHFARHISEARQQGQTDLAPEPKADIIEAILDVSFWASLRREEGHSPKISLAFFPSEQAVQPLLFERKIPLTSGMLTKLSSAVERPGIHLGVWCEKEELYVWGTTRKVPNLCFVLDVSEPGLLVIKHRRLDGFGKFTNVAVLIGDQVKVVDEQSSDMPDCPSILSSLVGSDSSMKGNNSVNILIQLAVSMRAHGRGGALLVVPDESNVWRGSVIHPINYAVNPAYSGLANLMLQDINERGEIQWQDQLRREVDHIGGLTAIDGATIISDQYQLLAFGAKIGRPDGKVPIEKIYFTEPIVGVEAKFANPAQLGGTRHLSASQFVQDQPDCLALVASQDGKFTIFSWSPCQEAVQAHRIDALLF